MDDTTQVFTLDLTVYIRAHNYAEAADKITKVLYAAIVDGNIADYRATGQPRVEANQT